MGRKTIDLTGQKFGRLTAIERAGTDKKGCVKWLCHCDCGSTTITRGVCLRNGKALSCGCGNKEAVTKANTKHGESRSKLYRVWAGIKDRCYNPNLKEYKNYGLRGIKMCDEWLHNYVAFREWAMSHGYTDKLSIDRIDVNDDYKPANCRWITMEEQQNNKRNTPHIEFKGETLTLKEWSKILGVGYGKLYQRIYRYHWTIEKALSTP